MGDTIAGVKVKHGAKVKWGTVGSLIIGVPAYVLTYGYTRALSMVFDGIEYVTIGPIEFLSTVLRIPFDDAVRGISRASTSFVIDVYDAGVAAPVIAAAGTAFVVYAIYAGVSRIYG